MSRGTANGEGNVMDEEKGGKKGGGLWTQPERDGIAHHPARLIKPLSTHEKCASRASAE